jgi:hypothetical protein
MPERSQKLQRAKAEMLAALRASLAVKINPPTDMPKDLLQRGRKFYSAQEFDKMIATEIAEIRAGLEECVAVLERAKTDAEIVIALKTAGEVASMSWWLDEDDQAQ